MMTPWKRKALEREQTIQAAERDFEDKPPQGSPFGEVGEIRQGTSLTDCINILSAKTVELEYQVRRLQLLFLFITIPLVGGLYWKMIYDNKSTAPEVPVLQWTAHQGD